jgi:hypothetical protein
VSSPPQLVAMTAAPATKIETRIHLDRQASDRMTPLFCVWSWISKASRTRFRFSEHRIRAAETAKREIVNFT